MNDFKVPYTTIVNITPHSNADKLEVATVYGFQVVVQKGRYKVGDKALYIPIDSILPQWLENDLFPPDSKIKLHRHRVRQIRIRGLASQGMLIDPNALTKPLSGLYDETDHAEQLGITKYDPPQPGFAQVQGIRKQRNKKTDHPLFHKYNGLDNIKWFPDLFEAGEPVMIQEKLHGTNARASKLPYCANTLWKKIKKYLRIAPKIENCYGSNNVDITASSDYKGYYGHDLYGEVFHKMNVFDKLKKGETVYGEIIGPGIQKNYDYGLTEPRFVLFDVKILMPDGKQHWLSPIQVQHFAKERGFEFVPVLYTGGFNKEEAYKLTQGPSLYGFNTPVREGIVIKSLYKYDQEGNKRALKWISEAYLDDKSNTDFH